MPKLSEWLVPPSVIEDVLQDLQGIPNNTWTRDSRGFRSITFGLTKSQVSSGLFISKSTIQFPMIWQKLRELAYNHNFGGTGAVPKFRFTSCRVRQNAFFDLEVPHRAISMPPTLYISCGGAQYKGLVNVHDTRSGKTYEFETANKFLLCAETDNIMILDMKPADIKFASFTGRKFDITFYSRPLRSPIHFFVVRCDALLGGLNGNRCTQRGSTQAR